MTFRVNGGIINSQTLTGSLRFFKLRGPLQWTVSDGTVNLPVITAGGAPTTTTYFTVGRDKPIPNSMADLCLQEISKKADIVIISLRPGTYGQTTEIDFACSASAFGWGSDVPNYTTNPGPEDLTAAAGEMTAAIRLLGVPDVAPNPGRRYVNVYISVGATPSPTSAPVQSKIYTDTLEIEEVSFALV